MALLGTANADALAPEEARRRMMLPEGFRVELVASEPEIRQPVAACFDERGRLWVIEYLQYPHPAGLKPTSVDVYLRTQYDRVPEPPPHGPRGADRIKILEDTDGDGRAEKVTTFIDGLNITTGLAVGHGGLFVAQAPYLLFYPDRDRDDVPDGDPEVLLTGFGMEDTHATVNSLAWGPDGWLYGAQGSTVTAKIRGVEFQQGIWRYHPRTREFELFAEGGGNTWGLDFDGAGNAFGSSNGGFVAFHMVQGGYYWKGFAKHGPLHNPRAYGYFDSLKYDGQKPGGHVTPGGIIYQGDNFPPEFRGAFIGGNLLSNAVYWHRIGPDGSTFSARPGGTLLDAQDVWFRPIDLLTGPDGCVYLVDWYDRRASHLDPRDTWDKTNGRIYRIVHGERKPIPPFDLSTWSGEKLLSLRSHPNAWWPETARRVLAERRDASLAERLLASLRDERREDLALRDLWALNACAGLDDRTALELLDHPLAGVRRWTVRLLGDERRMDDRFLDRLTRLAAEEPDPTVRSQLASSCQRWEIDAALPILAALWGRPDDLGDPHVPLLIWWALEHQMRTDAAAAVAAVSDPATQQLPLVREFLLERTARALIEGGSAEDLARCARLLAAAPSAAEADRIVAGMEKGLEGRRLDAVPGPLEATVRSLIDRADSDPLRLRLAVRLGSRPALDRAIARASDRAVAEVERRGLIALIGEAKTDGGLTALLELLGRDDERPSVTQAVLDALGGYDDPAVAAALLDRYAGLPAAGRARVLDLLTTRRDWADRLITAMAAGRVPPADLRPTQVLQVVQLDDSELISRLEGVWGKIPGPGSEDKVRRIAEVRGILPEGDKGVAARGRAVFQEHCAVCHELFGEGETIGPELTGAERRDLDFLLTNIVDPSALIRSEYQAQTLALADGRVLSGLIVEDSEASLTLVDSQRQRHVVAKDEIDAMRPSETSLMPEGLIDTLPDDQVRDLFRYLQSSGPPASPER